jgi:hypothetical protein
MRTRILALLSLAALLLIAFDCITDDLSILLNVKPLNATYAVNPGPPSYAGSVTIDRRSLYDESYTLTGVSVSDIKLSTNGPDLGAFSGTVRVNGVILFTYSGDWTAFNTPQSVLTSRLLTKNQPGIDALINTVIEQRSVVLTVSGDVRTAPAAKNTNSVTVYASVQAYGHR